MSKTISYLQALKRDRRRAVIFRDSQKKIPAPRPLRIDPPEAPKSRPLSEQCGPVSNTVWSRMTRTGPRRTRANAAQSPGYCRASDANTGSCLVNGGRVASTLSTECRLRSHSCWIQCLGGGLQPPIRAKTITRLPQTTRKSIALPIGPVSAATHSLDYLARAFQLSGAKRKSRIRYKIVSPERIRM